MEAIQASYLWKYDATSLINALPPYAYASGDYSVGDERTLLPDDYRRGYTQSAGAFYGSIHKETGFQLAEAIFNIANGGDTPIRSLILVGHGDRRIESIGGFNDGGQFKFSMLKSGANAKYGPWEKIDDWDWITNTNKALPYGCWFSADAEVRFVGCKTNDFSEAMAKNVIRESGTVYGTSKFTAASPTPGEWMSFFTGSRSTRLITPYHYSPTSYHTSSYWNSHKGKN